MVKDILDTIQIESMSAVDGETFDEHRYNLLSMLAAGSCLTTVKNVRESHGIRGSLAWHRITRDVAGKSGHRLERLLNRVHHPPKISSYSNAEQMLTNWQAACIELEKLEKQNISEPTKRTVLKNMLPPDLIRDLERDPQLKSFERAWPFVLEQCPLRKDWLSTSGKKKDGPTPMDLDAMENALATGTSSSG